MLLLLGAASKSCQSRWQGHRHDAVCLHVQYFLRQDLKVNSTTILVRYREGQQAAGPIILTTVHSGRNRSVIGEGLLCAEVVF